MIDMLCSTLAINEDDAERLLEDNDWDMRAAAEAHFADEMRDGHARQQAELEENLRAAEETKRLPYVGRSKLLFFPYIFSFLRLFLL